MMEVIGPDGVGREMEPELAGEVTRKVFEGAFRELMGGVMLPAPGADPGFRGGITPGMIGERLGRGVPEGFLTEPVRTEVTPELVEKVYRVAEEAGFASGGLVGAKFKELYPTFEAYKKAMADMKIPLDEVVKQRAKGPSYHSLPATEAEYLARIGESSSLMDSIRSLQPKGQERALVSISELRGKSGLSPAEFDAELWKLAQEGKVVLHPHDFASSLKPEERAKLLAVPNKNAYWGGHDYYVGVVPK